MRCYTRDKKKCMQVAFWIIFTMLPEKLLFSVHPRNPTLKFQLGRIKILVSQSTFKSTRLASQSPLWYQTSTLTPQSLVKPFSQTFPTKAIRTQMTSISSLWSHTSRSYYHNWFTRSRSRSDDFLGHAREYRKASRRIAGIIARVYHTFVPALLTGL